jgi:DnaJ-class molecular chaperone
VEFRDYYQTLGLPRTATPAEIKKAYRKLARQHHPDVKPGDTAAEARFKEINEAHEVLSDPGKRKLYDQLGADWDRYGKAGAPGGGPSTGGGPGGGDPFGPGGPFAGYARRAGAAGPGGTRYEFRTSDPEAGGFSDFFRMFFGGDPGGSAGAGGRRGSGGGSTPRTSTASIEDLLGGMGYETGSGAYPAGAFDAAGPDATRGGARRSSSGRAAPRAVEAPVEVTLAEAAAGTTRIVEIDGARLEVKIPRGVTTGSRVRLRGKGGGGRDLVLVIRVAPHPVFTRSGADLTRDLPVTLREALIGAEVPVETLDGRVRLKVPAGTQNGSTIRLKGKGMPHLRGEARGDLLVKVKVVLPTRLSDEARAAAETLLDLVDQPDPRTT